MDRVKRLSFERYSKEKKYFSNYVYPSLGLSPSTLLGLTSDDDGMLDLWQPLVGDGYRALVLAGVLWSGGPDGEDGAGGRLLRIGPLPVALQRDDPVHRNHRVVLVNLVPQDHHVVCHKRGYYSKESQEIFKLCHKKRIL